MKKLLSVTFLSSYLYCPRKLYLEQVLKIVKIPKEAMLKGTIRHNAFEGINEAEKELVTSIEKGFTYQDVEGSYKKAYSQILNDSILRNNKQIVELGMDKNQIFNVAIKLILSEAKTRALNAFSFSQKNKLFKEELWNALTPKIKSEVRLESNTLGLKGIVDEVKIYENEIVPVELKTGKAPQSGVWPGHKVQLGAYIMMLKESYKLPIKEGILRYLDHDAQRQIVLDPFLIKEIIDLIKKVNELFNSRIPPMCTNKNKCKACQLYEECVKK